MLGAEGLAEDEEEGLREALGLNEAEGEREALDDGEIEALGETLREALELGLTDAEGLRDEDGLIDVELDGLMELEGLIDWLAEGLRLGEADELTLLEGENEALGDSEAEGERETSKLCIHISQLVAGVVEVFLNSNISPKTLPAGCGP